MKINLPPKRREDLRRAQRAYVGAQEKATVARVAYLELVAALASEFSLGIVADALGVSRQYVHQLVNESRAPKAAAQ